MAATVSDMVLDRLEARGVRQLYGCPGDGINAVFGALNQAGERFEFVQTRHEEMAAFMACGHAKYTGELGVCIATSGPGAIHLLNGPYDAKLDHQLEAGSDETTANKVAGKRAGLGARAQHYRDHQHGSRVLSIHTTSAVVAEAAFNTGGTWTTGQACRAVAARPGGWWTAAVRPRPTSVPSHQRRGQGRSAALRSARTQRSNAVKPRFRPPQSGGATRS